MIDTKLMKKFEKVLIMERPNDSSAQLYAILHRDSVRRRLAGTTVLLGPFVAGLHTF